MPALEQGSVRTHMAGESFRLQANSAVDIRWRSCAPSSEGRGRSQGQILPHEVPPKTGFIRGLVRIRISGTQRWRDADGKRLYEWDSLHGELEMYNERGRHLGAVDPQTGALIKPPVKGRKIDV